MPQFFFHLYDDDVSRDEEGIDLPDEAAARDKALECARDMACVEVLKGRLRLHHRIEVEDEAGRTVATLTFGDAVTLEE